MEETGTLLQWIVGQAGVGGLAAFALFLLNAVWKQRVEDEKQNASQINEMRKQTLDALQRNTEVVTRLVERLDKQK